eukprot:4253723-Amphidinium_carterae.1
MAIDLAKGTGSKGVCKGEDEDCTVITEGKREHASLSEQLAVELPKEALTGKDDDHKKNMIGESSVCSTFVPVSGLLILFVDDLLSCLKVGVLCSMDIWVQHLATFAVQCTMRDYIMEKIDPIALPRNLKETESTHTASECVVDGKDQKEALLTRARPEVFGATTYIASTKAAELTQTHLREAAKTVKHLKQIADMSLLLHLLPPEQVRIA